MAKRTENPLQKFTENAHSRLPERAFTLWEEAGGNVDEGFALWHRLRPLLSPKQFPSLIHRPSDPNFARSSPAREA